MIQYPALETSPNWSVAPWDTGIGPVKPNKATVLPASATNPSLSCFLDAPPNYSNALYDMKVLPPAWSFFYPSNVAFAFDFTVILDSAGPKLQCIEFEPLWYYQGFNYRNQMQLAMVEGNKIQAYTPQKVWADTGIEVSPPQIGVPWPVTVLYVADTVAHTISTPSIMVCERLFPLPSQFQKIPAQPSTWAEAVYVQFQLGGPKAGIKTTVDFQGINLRWL